MIKLKKIIGDFALTVTFVLLYSACSNNEVSDKETAHIEINDTIKSGIIVNSEYTQRELMFTTNKDWYIKYNDEINANWLHISSISGKAGDNIVKLIFEKNLSYSDRETVLDIYSGDIQKEIKVKQLQKNVLLIDKHRYDVPAKGSIITIEANTNVEYDILIPKEYSEWIVNKSINTRSLHSSKINIQVKENKSSKERSGFLIFSSISEPDTIHFIQEGQEIISLDKDYFTINSDGGEIVAGVSCNYKIDIQKNNDNWIQTTINDIQAHADSLNLIFKISPNTTKSIRASNIVLTKGNIEKQKITILQYSKDMINEIEDIDLGLSVKWGNLNIGAKGIYDYGELYPWGVTNNNSIQSEPPINTSISGTKYDIATEEWKGDWRLPTKVEIKELIDNCSWKWTVINNVEGALVTGKNGNQIFLPASGYYSYGDINKRGYECVYSSGNSRPASYIGQETTQWIEALVCEYNGSRYINGFRYYTNLAIRPVKSKLKVEK